MFSYDISQSSEKSSNSQPDERENKKQKLNNQKESERGVKGIGVQLGISNPVLYHDQNVSNNQRRSSMFATAKGNLISISEEALAKGRQLIDSDTAIDKDKLQKPPPIPIPSSSSSGGRSSMFSTAKGGSISISEEAMKKGRQLMDNDDTNSEKKAQLTIRVAPAVAESSSSSPSIQAAAAAVVADVDVDDLLGSQLHVNSHAHKVSTERNDVNAEVVKLSEMEVEVSDKIEDEVEQQLQPVRQERSLDLLPILFTHSFKRSDFILNDCNFNVLDHDAAVWSVCSSNSMNVIFSADGCYFNPDNNNSQLIVTQIIGYFKLGLVSVDAREWLAMQVRWIIWSLAAMERRPSISSLNGRILVYENVLAIAIHRWNQYHITSATRTTPVSRRTSLASKSSRSGTATSTTTATTTPTTMPTSSLSSSVPTGSLIKQRFTPLRSQSPLQRCLGIGSLVWPITLCIAIEYSQTGTKMIVKKMEVTDGWYWCKVLVDSHLCTLIDKRVLKDGCKLSVVSATFSIDGPRTTLLLNINGVRKAKNSAKLGFINPIFLNQGLSERSIVSNGGSVYALRGQVVHICERKVRTRLPDGTGRQRSSILLSQSEFNEIAMYESSRQQSMYENMSEREGFSIESILQEMGNESLLTDGCRSFDSNMTQQQQLQVRSTLEKARTIQAQRIQQSIATNAFSGIIQGNVTQIQDVLVRCSISLSLFWVRFYNNIPNLVKDGIYLFTNMNLTRGLCTHRIYSSSKSTGVKALTPRSSSNSGGSSSESKVVRRGNSMSGSSMNPCICLRNVREVSICSAMYPLEASFQCTIISWEKQSVDENMMVEYRIQCIDKSRLLINFSLNLPQMVRIEAHQSWLHEKQTIFISFALVRSFDSKYDVLTCERHDRTTVQVINTNTDTNPNTTTTNALVISPDIIQEEVLRYAALSSGKAMYDCPYVFGRSVSCQRKILREVIISYNINSTTKTTTTTSDSSSIGNKYTCVVSAEKNVDIQSDIYLEIDARFTSLITQLKDMNENGIGSRCDVVYCDAYDFGLEDVESINVLLYLNESKRQ